MGITEQNIIDYMNSLGKIAGANTSVCVVRLPSLVNMAFYGPMSVVLDMQYSVMNVSELGIMLIGIDGMGRLSSNYLWLDRNDIQNITCKKGLIKYKVIINTNNGSIKYNLNKIMIGSKFHKKNINGTLEIIQKTYN